MEKRPGLANFKNNNEAILIPTASIADIIKQLQTMMVLMVLDARVDWATAVQPMTLTQNFLTAKSARWLSTGPMRGFIWHI